MTFLPNTADLFLVASLTSNLMQTMKKLKRKLLCVGGLLGYLGLGWVDFYRMKEAGNVGLADCLLLVCPQD